LLSVINTPQKFDTDSDTDPDKDGIVGRSRDRYQPPNPCCIFGCANPAQPGSGLDFHMLSPAVLGLPGSGQESAGYPKTVIVVPVLRVAVVAVGATKVVSIVVVPRPAAQHARANIGRPLLQAFNPSSGHSSYFIYHFGDVFILTHANEFLFQTKPYLKPKPFE
jgi:hypothetical protein